MAKNLLLFAKIIFVICASLFFMSMTLAPQTDCEACSIEWNGKNINGYEAFETYEDACIGYEKPWEADKEPIYINIDELNMTVNISEQFPVAEEISFVG